MTEGIMKQIAILTLAVMLVSAFYGPGIADEIENENNSQMTLEERMEYLGLDIPDSVKAIFEELDKEPPPVLLNTQDVFDWRQMGGVTPVKNQASCGSCWDFAATGAFESAVLIEDGVEWDFSEQAIIDCNWGGSSCNGGWMSDAYAVFADFGAIEEDCYPYRARNGFPCEQDTCVVIVTLESWENIPNNVNSIKNALLDGPLSTTFTVHDGFSWDCYENVYTSPNHAVVFVGWDDNLCEDGAWIVKNSWADTWGDGGYFYMPYGSCGIGHYTQRPIYISRLPEITYNPEEFEIYVPYGGSTTETLSLSNLGEGDLYYRIRMFNSAFQDSFGYYWFDSDNPQGPEYGWVDITVNGEIVEFPGNPDVSNSGPYDLGFDFEFYGNTFSSINICSNGWMSFTDSTTTAYYNRRIPHSSAPNNMIAPFWENLNPGLGGNVYFYTNNTDSAVISWVDVPDTHEEGEFTFQAVLVAPNSVTFQYGDMGPEGPIDRASVGIENAAGTVGLQICYNETFSGEGMAYRFELGQPAGEFDWLSVDDDNGYIYPADVIDVEVTCDAGDHQAGTYYGYLSLDSNDPEIPHVEIPVTMNIGMTSVDDDPQLPLKTSLMQNFPNPFNPSTEIAFTLASESEISLDIYNIMGQHIENLYKGEKSAGEHVLSWDGSKYASGIYLYKLSAGEKSFTRRMTLIK
ncbi:MAG: T9SS type A sorting domain-containing protein [candidate division Zixibacteria bacterium]|nr:T9SS type A sorting domain-containing protein [candidate division Zixibacteria bacterium]